MREGITSWSPRAHHDMILAKAYKQLGLICRTFSSSMSIRAKKILYLTLVRSQVTYCSQIWRPHLIKDIIRHTHTHTHILFFVKSFKYPDPSFQISNFVSFSSASTRSGSAVKLIHKHSRTSLAHHSYFHRLVRIWNSLPPIDLSLSFLIIKTQLIKILWCNFLSYFHPSHPCSFHVICPCCK